MNPEKQRIKIAEACGWTDIKPTGNFLQTPCGSDPDPDEGWGSLPDYLNDLNAMHEVEKTLSDEQWREYIVKLARVIAGAKRNEKVSVPTSILISAIAAQRSEAFLRTLNLWEDEV